MCDLDPLPLTNRNLILYLGQQIRFLFFPKNLVVSQDNVNEIVIMILLAFFDDNEYSKYVDTDIGKLIVCAIPGLLIEPKWYLHYVRDILKLIDYDDIIVYAPMCEYNISDYKRAFLTKKEGRAELLLQVEVKEMFEKNAFTAFMERLRFCKITATAINVIMYVLNNYNLSAAINFHLLVLMHKSDYFITNLFRFCANCIYKKLNLTTELKRLHDIMRYYKIDFNFNDLDNDEYTTYLYAYCLLSRDNSDEIDLLKNVYNRILPVMSVMIDLPGYILMKKNMLSNIEMKLEKVRVDKICTINEHLMKLSIFGAAGSARGAKIKLHDFTNANDVSVYIKLNKKQFMNLMPDIDLNDYSDPFLVTGSAIKHEVGQKNRQLWNTAVDVYVLMDYILSYTEKLILNEPVIKLYSNATDLIKWHQNIKDNESYWLMWDYSDFNIDHSLDIQAEIFFTIGAKLSAMGCVNDYTRACHIVSKMLSNTVLRVKDDFICVFRTLITGSRHTTFMNTIGNYIYTKTIFSQLGYDLNNDFDAIQGDDGAFKCDSYRNAFRKYIALQISGYPGTGSKMLLGNDVEFLRIMYCSSGARGCALRVLAAGCVPEYKNEYSNSDIISMGMSIQDKIRLFNARGLSTLFVEQLFSRRTTITYTIASSGKTIKLGHKYNATIGLLDKKQGGDGRITYNDQCIHVDEQSICKQIADIREQIIIDEQSSEYNNIVENIVDAYPSLRLDQVVINVCRSLNKIDMIANVTQKLRVAIYGNQMPSYMKKTMYDEMIRKLMYFEYSTLCDRLCKYRKTLQMHYAGNYNMLLAVMQMTYNDIVFLADCYMSQDDAYAFIAMEAFLVDGGTLKTLINKDELINLTHDLHKLNRIGSKQHDLIVYNSKYWHQSETMNSYVYFYDDVEINSLISKAFVVMTYDLIDKNKFDYDVINTLYLACKKHINTMFGSWHANL